MTELNRKIEKAPEHKLSVVQRAHNTVHALDSCLREGIVEPIKTPELKAFIQTKTSFLDAHGNKTPASFLQDFTDLAHHYRSFIRDRKSPSYLNLEEILYGQMNIETIMAFAKEIQFNPQILRQILTEVSGQLSRDERDDISMVTWIILASKQENISEEAVLKLVQQLKLECRPKGKMELHNGLWIVPTAFESGLTSDQSSALIINMANNFVGSGFHYRDLRSGLAVTHDHKLDPKVIFEVLTRQIDEQIYTLDILPKVLNLGTQVLGTTAKEILDFWVFCIEKKKRDSEFTHGVFVGKLDRLSLFATPVSPSSQRLKEAILNKDIEFIEKRGNEIPGSQKNEFLTREGKLFISPCVYKINNKGRTGGESDLITLASQEKLEGFWVYDDVGHTWYGLGGKNTPTMGGVRLEIYPFDISKLAKEPELYHIHPVALAHELEIVNTYISKESGTQQMFTALDMILPSQADLSLAFNLSSEGGELEKYPFRIVHIFGITEVHLAANTDDIERAIQNFRETKSQIYRLLLERSKNVDVESFVVDALTALNQALQPSINISLRPQTVKFSSTV